MVLIWIMTSNILAQESSDSTKVKSESYSRLYLVENAGIWAFFELNSILGSNRYYLVIPMHQMYLACRLNKHIHLGAYVGAARSFSSHNERAIGHWAGLRSEFQWQFKPNLRLFSSVEIGSQMIYSQTLPSQMNPDSIQPFVVKNYTQFLLPVSIGIQTKLNRKRCERMDIYWAPEIQYNFPIGYQYEKFTPYQNILFDLFRFTFEFKK